MDSDNSVRHLYIYDEDGDSLFAGRRRRPRIRDAIRQTAEDFGKEVLREERRKKREPRRQRRRFRPLAGLFGSRNDEDDDDEDLGGASFVADQFIAVIMQHDEDLFLVGVFADDDDDDEEED